VDHFTVGDAIFIDPSFDDLKLAQRCLVGMGFDKEG
jgi:hypothetical protein